MLQIFIVYYGLPHFYDLFAAEMHFSFRSNKIPLYAYAIVAFSINASAYASEIIRAGILAVGKGEIEAAYSIGMSTPQVLRRIIIPQAVIVGLPNFTNQFIGLVHGSSMAFWISVVEITGKANLVAAATYQFVEAFCVAALIYWMLTIIIEQIMAYFERRYRKILAKGIA